MLHYESKIIAHKIKIEVLKKSIHVFTFTKIANHYIVLAFKICLYRAEDQRYHSATEFKEKTKPNKLTQTNFLARCS